MTRPALVLALALVWPAAPAFAQTCVNTTDLLAWWRADGTAADATGMRHGTFVGTERYEAGVSGQAFSFDGASYVSVPNDLAFTANTGLTVAAWIRRGTDFGFLAPVMKMPGYDDRSGFAFEMFGASAGLHVALQDQLGTPIGWHSVLAAVPQDEWTHVAGTFDGATIRIYVNGQLINSASAAGMIRPAGGELHIGHDPINSYRFARGPIDDAVIFERPLNDQEISALYQNGLAGCPLDQRERPAIVWNPGPLTTAIPLGPSQLNAQSSVAGGFDYRPAAGTFLAMGQAVLVASFTPDDSVRYRPVKAYRLVNVEWQNFTTDASAPAMVTMVPDAGGTGADPIVDAARGRVWVVSRGRGALLVLDERTGAEIAAVSADTRLLGPLALDATRGRVYAAENDRPVVRIYDVETFGQIGHIDLAGYPTALAVDGGGARLYVGVGGGVQGFALPIASNEQAPVADIGIGFTPGVVVVDPVRGILYAQSSQGPLDVAAIDIDQQRPTVNTVLWSQTTDARRPALAVNPRTGFVYVGATEEAHLVRVLDGRRDSPTFGAFVTPLPIPPDPFVVRGVTGLAVNPVTNVVYAQLGDMQYQGFPIAPELVAIDGATGALLSEVRLDVLPLDRRRFHFGAGLAVNPATNRIYVAADDDALVFFQEISRTTRTVSDDGAVAPVTISTSAAQVTFADVTQAGSLQVQSLDVGALGIPAAGQFVLGEAVGFEISTTASVSAPFTVCLNASHVTVPDAFAALSLLHAETVNGTYQWVDRTVSRDFSTGMVCGETSSLSPFAVAKRIGPRYSLKVLFDNTRPRQAGSTIPVRLGILDDGRELSDAGLPVVAVDVLNLQTKATAMASDAGSSNPSGAFRFDSTLTYAFNLSTKGLAAGSYALRVRIGADPTLHEVRFEVR